MFELWAKKIEIFRKFWEVLEIIRLGKLEKIE
jgi:hypothetical protein